MPSHAGLRFVAVALTLAALLSLAGYWVLKVLELDANVMVAIATALVVGTFVALILLGRRATPKVDEGFDVEEARRVSTDEDDESGHR
jgi:hypothetical protein